MTNRFGIDTLGYGLGLRAPHYEHILRAKPRSVDWFEIISENFMQAHKGYWDFLAELRQDYPIVMHGVSLSAGSPDPLNEDYVKALKALADFINPPWLSDHVCWTGVHGRNTHDLLPVAYNNASLEHMADRVKQVQDRLGRVMLMENPSSYVEFNESTMPEWEFMAQLSEKADCGLLLDINNIYVSAFNHGFDARRYIDAMPASRIMQIHLAGHSHCGTHIIDTHDSAVAGDVWELYSYALQQKGSITTMVEWDGKIPAFDVLEAELGKARAHGAQALGQAA
jgi:uncharacterized protein (UPF0276 family)